MDRKVKYKRIRKGRKEMVMGSVRKGRRRSSIKPGSCAIKSRFFPPPSSQGNATRRQSLGYAHTQIDCSFLSFSFIRVGCKPKSLKTASFSSSSSSSFILLHSNSSLYAFRLEPNSIQLNPFPFHFLSYFVITLVFKCKCNCAKLGTLFFFFSFTSCLI